MAWDWVARVRLTRHAELALRECGIERAWLEQTIEQLSVEETDPSDPSLVRYYRPIPEFGGRWLRVVFGGTGRNSS